MRAEAQVDVFDIMPSVGRKFLLAGKGGLNLTHSEAFEPFLARYGERREMIAPLLGAFGPDTLIAWARTLGFGLGALAWLVGQEMLAERA